MSWCVSRPPPPCARTMRSSATRGTGQFRLNELILASAIVVIGRACAFRRYHGSAERILRRTLHSERRALVRLLDALQNESADALGRFARRFAGKRVTAVSVIFLKTPAQLEAAGRNLAKAAPLARDYLEDVRDALLRRSVPFPPNRAAVLVFSSWRLSSNCVAVIRMPSRISSGSKPVTTIGTL